MTNTTAIYDLETPRLFGIMGLFGKASRIHVSAQFMICLFQVANLACSISNNEEGVKLVRMAATQIDSLCPQVRTRASVTFFFFLYIYIQNFEIGKRRDGLESAFAGFPQIVVKSMSWTRMINLKQAGSQCAHLPRARKGSANNNNGQTDTSDVTSWRNKEK